MDVAHLFTIAFGAIGIIGIAGGAVGFFAKGRGDSIIAYQSNEISLRDGTITRLEKTLGQTTAERDAYMSEIEHMRSRNKELIELAQGSPQLRTLTETVALLAQRMGVIIHQEEQKNE